MRQSKNILTEKEMENGGRVNYFDGLNFLVSSLAR